MSDVELTYLLLDSRPGFKLKEQINIVYNAKKDGLCLKKKQKPVKDKTGSFGGLALPAGIAHDEYGNIYIVDTENALLLKYDFCTPVPVPVPCTSTQGDMPAQFDSPAGIAIPYSNYVYIADTGNKRIQVFYAKGFTLKDVWGASSGLEFDEPRDLAVDSRENLYVVDRGKNCIHKINKNGTLITSFGSTVLVNPLYIAIDLNDHVYVIDDGAQVKKFDEKGNLLCELSFTEEAAGNFYPPFLFVDASGRIHYRFTYSRHTLVMKHDERIAQADIPDHMAIVKQGVIPGIYFDNGTLTINPQNVPAPRAGEVLYEKEGFFFTGALDSREHNCQWHKILIDASIPLGTSITVQTYTAEISKDFFEIKNLDPLLWQTNQKNAENLLIQGPPGRYLWLKVLFMSNSKETPVINRIKIYYPRITYLQYLPKLYQEDPESKEFLEKFLSIFEHFFTGIEDKIDTMAKYFNPASTPPEFIRWLASWLALSINDRWDKKTTRVFIKKAHNLFKKRGTVQGLQEVLKIFTNKKFPVIEHFQLRKKYLVLSKNSIIGNNSYLWEKESSLGQNTWLSAFYLGDGRIPMQDFFTVHAHKFSVLIPSLYCRDREQERLLRRIIEQWKPAHTSYSLCKIEPGFKVGKQSELGINSIIGEYREIVLNYSSELGKEIVLGKTGKDGDPGEFILNKQTRLNKNTIIK